MTTTRSQMRFSLQTKVLVAVILFLVLLPVATLWIVNDHMVQQMEDEALQTLATAESVFSKSLENRSRTMLARYRSLAEEARFKVVAELDDPRTIEQLLAALLEDAPEDHAVILFFNAEEELRAARRRSPLIELEKFTREAEAVTRIAHGGETGIGVAGFDGRVFSVIAVPVTGPNQGPRTGVLVVGIQIGEAAINELKLPRTEILLMANGRTIVSTISNPELSATLLQETTSAAQRVVLAGEHFMARSGDLAATLGPQSPVRYVMLSSYEQRLRALEGTRRTLVGVSVTGIVISALVVSWFVRRVTQPLRELAETAEAVGRGDFSRRIERFSDDECGDLAQTFNRMTANLQGSRAELEKAVVTLKSTQAQLIQSEKLSAVGQFVAGVAHELNNPLTAVIGFSDLLVQVNREEKMRPQLELIAKSAHRCHKIVQNLLSFARQHAPERKFIKLKSVIEEVIEIMNYDLRTSNIRVVTDFDAHLPDIMADPHQLQQVFINMLSNARQAIQTFRQDGEITVRTKAVGDCVRVEFADNGPGISPANLARIFDPFFTTKPVGKGTGLGLSLSYGIIQEHGGRITAHSEVGQGATFVIELPLKQDATAVRPGSVPPFPRARPSGTGRSVLVVDDEPWIRDLIRSLLEQDGYAVETVAGGESAIAALQGRKFDVIVTDWKMPGMNGIQLYEHLVTTDTALARRVLFMSGDVINDVFEDFLRRHGKTCLPKPFEIDDFRAAVAAVLEAN